MLFDGSRVDFVEVLAEGDRLFSTVSVFLVLVEDGFDFEVEAVTPVSDEQDLKSFFDRYSSAITFVVHEELSQVVELSWLKTALVVSASLVHDLEFVLADVAVEVVVDLPDVEGHFGPQQLKTKPRQLLHEIRWTNLILVLLSLLRILLTQMSKNTIQTVLLNARNRLRLQHLPRRLNNLLLIRSAPKRSLRLLTWVHQIF